MCRICVAKLTSFFTLDCVTLWSLLQIKVAYVTALLRCSANFCLFSRRESIFSELLRKWLSHVFFPPSLYQIKHHFICVCVCGIRVTQKNIDADSTFSEWHKYQLRWRVEKQVDATAAIFIFIFILCKTFSFCWSRSPWLGFWQFGKFEIMGFNQSLAVGLRAWHGVAWWLILKMWVWVAARLGWHC